MAETLDWADRIGAALRLDSVAQGKSGDLLAAIGGAVQSVVERGTGRRLTPTTFYEVYSGSGTMIQVLNQDPIRSVSLLSVNGVPVTVAALTDVPVWPPAAGCVIRPGGYLELTGASPSFGPYVFAAGVMNVIVQYVAGFDPNDDGAALVQAGVEWGKQIYKNADRVGLKSLTVAGQTSTFTDDMPPLMKATIASHRRLMKWGM